MKFLKRLKSSNFWVSMISAVVLILQAVFNVEIKTEYLNQIILGILGLLVMSGIVSDSSSDEVTVKQDVDMEGIKQNVTSILEQVASSFETNISGVVKQFVTIGEKLNLANLFGVQNGDHNAAKDGENISAETAVANKVEQPIVEELITDNQVSPIVESISQNITNVPTQPIVDEQNTL